LFNNVAKQLAPRLERRMDRVLAQNIRIDPETPSDAPLELE